MSGVVGGAGVEGGGGVAGAVWVARGVRVAGAVGVAGGCADGPGARIGTCAGTEPGAGAPAARTYPNSTATQNPQIPAPARTNITSRKRRNSPIAEGSRAHGATADSRHGHSMVNAETEGAPVDDTCRRPSHFWVNSSPFDVYRPIKVPVWSSTNSHDRQPPRRPV